ncbi:histidinol-phosphate aminotransferase [Roseovarius halotolerans]|uniref:Histidinol-phosphate aminotransferase n=1 Tax=Roseovarius halotolerans TaxID=505353 RepID=A0A1X6Y997_9RHOB|nr:pyridoxal phosphate-dependent aminotransferase [Roseovarius halotolerans]RKT35178.1 histidinol-phosphate aminotransferase [Roseovarius halotolerans]SLN12625.1 Histidinol-phosphate aminotransferase [Roseovarius halotolerans]
MTEPRYTDLVQTLPANVPFVGPEEQERARGAPFRARLGANESLFGPSPAAVKAMQAEALETWKYGDPSSHDLRAALAAGIGCDVENILVGEGIDGLLGNLVRLLVAPGDAVVTSDGAYPTFNYHVAGFGGALHKVPYRDDHEDPAALLTKAKEVDAKLVYLANPDNPMGSWHSGSDIRTALDDLPEGCLLLLDEAYIEFAPEGTAAAIDADDPRVIKMRTFSKAYGMAGARIGYAIGARGLIRSFDKIRNHFGMNRMAQAGALAAFDDAAWLLHVQGEVARARDRIALIAQENGLRALPSATNFVAVDCGADGAFASAVLEALVARGVFVRKPFVAPQDRCIRISCGRPQDLDVLAEVLPEALSAARG